MMLLLCCLISCLAMTKSISTTFPTSASEDSYRFEDTHPYAGISVPFFLYSGGDFDIFWNSCQKFVYSKGVEVSFLLHLQDHPWRTYDASEAALFVIPGLFSVAMRTFANKTLCKHSVEDMSKTLAAAVKQSPWFERHGGRDHLMVVGYFKAEMFMSLQTFEWREIIKLITLGLHSEDKKYIGRDHTGCIISVGHIASPHSHSKVEVQTKADLTHMRPLTQHLLDKQAQNALRPQRRTLIMLGQAKYLYYENRVTAIKVLGRVGENSFVAASKCSATLRLRPCASSARMNGIQNISAVSNCCLRKSLPYSVFVKQMMMSNFSLLIGGGDPGSSRCADAVALSIPQLILSDGFYTRYAPFPCIVPWRDFTEEITEREFKADPVAAMELAVRRATSRRESMIRLQQQYARDVDWTHPRSLAANNLLVETVRRCFPRNVSAKSDIVTRIVKKTNKVKCLSN